MIDKETFRMRIVTLRRARHMSQGSLAEHMGVTPQAVSKWERGLCLPDLLILDELAEILGVDVRELLMG